MTGRDWSPSRQERQAWLSHSWLAPADARCGRLLGGARDSPYEVVHGLDLVHRQLLAGRNHDGAVLFGDRTLPDRFLAGIDLFLELEDIRLRCRWHGGA